MPIYTYAPERPPEEGEEPLPLVERMYAYPPPELIKVEGVMYARTQVERVAVVGLRPEPSQGDQVLRGYYDLECSNRLRLPNGFNAEGVKRVWKDDRLTEAEKAGDSGDTEASTALLATQHAI